MRMHILRRLVPLAFTLLFLAGCQPAERYGVKSTTKERDSYKKNVKSDEGPKSVPRDFAWIAPDTDRMAPDIPIQFVAASDPDEWKKLTKFWTPAVPLPPAFVGLDPFGTGALAKMAQARVVKIKVPAGLWDPNKYEYLPPTNPPTVGKWELGKRLFFDTSWLVPPEESRLACATCHVPETGFCNRRHIPPTLKPPSLINCAFNRWQFHDGRARALEEVVQQTLDDERAGPGDAVRRHVWGGVVARLRAHHDFPKRFKAVFGTLVTQDAIGKALATYMRTILNGDSIYDRALAAARGSYAKPKELTADHFETALKSDGKDGKDTIAALNRQLERAEMKEYQPNNPNQLARDLLDGYKLFKDRGRCARCHSDLRDFTDYGFHNLNRGLSNPDNPNPVRDFGRIRVAPVGLKDRSLVGAVKTPNLRSLSRTAPYWHDGSGVHPTGDRNKLGLFQVVVWHMRGGQAQSSQKNDKINPYLDKELRNDKGEPLDLKLTEREMRDLVLFLLALDGEEVDPIVKDKDQWPPGMTPPK
jgi:cytochrome c peroxidase